MFVSSFPKFVSHGVFDIFSRVFVASNHCLKYGALLWNYARRKQNNGAISESEVTKNVTRKHGGFQKFKKVVSKIQIHNRINHKIGLQ